MKNKQRKLFSILIPVAAVVSALLVGALIILLSGANPIQAYSALLKGALGSTNSIAEIIVHATPLILTGLAVAFAFKSGVFNIGGDGQILMGALLATIVGVYIQGLPMWIHLPLAVLAGFIGGAIWMIIPGYLYIKLNVNSIISTIMLNWVAYFQVMYLVNGPIRDETSWTNQSYKVAESAQIPLLIAKTRAHYGFVMAIIAGILIYLILTKTVLGFKIQAVGENTEAATYGGINKIKNILIASTISGGLAGIAGMSEITGVYHRLLIEVSPGIGYTAVVIALLGRNNPFGVILSSILFAVLKVGSQMMQQQTGIPVPLVSAITGIIFFFWLFGEYYRVRLETGNISE